MSSSRRGPNTKGPEQDPRSWVPQRDPETDLFLALAKSEIPESHLAGAGSALRVFETLVETLLELSEGPVPRSPDVPPAPCARPPRAGEELSAGFAGRIFRIFAGRPRTASEDRPERPLDDI